MVSSLPAEYLDPDTPPEVVVTDQIRPPITDSTLGVPLQVPGPDLPSVPDPPRHQLVTVGDSLTHGMSSGAVFHTNLSWPALVARSLRAGLVVPTYGGPLDGLPLNIEKLLRDLQGRFGDTLNLLEMIQLPLESHSLADANEDYWERGDGSHPPRTDLRYENVGIYGWDVRDCLSSTTARALARIASHPPHDDLLGAKPDNDNDIAAASVLAPFGSAAAQIDAVASHGHDGGIGTLVVMLGANDTIQDHVRRARADGRDWHLVDLCGILDGVAYRRYLADPAASTAQQGWQPYPLPAPIADLDTRFYRSDETGRLQGGLFGLDAVHPTTAGYGIIAQAVLDVLSAAGIASPGIDFTQLLAEDTLNSSPPALFTRIFTLLAPFLTRLAGTAP